MPSEETPLRPTVDEVEFRALYKKTRYVAETADRWSLVVTRYRPVPQPFLQPVLNEPLLLVHGFSQNRHAWSSGEFVKNLLYFGVDVHVLELRGHGKSSIAFQRERAEKLGRAPPPDLDYGWDIDSYFLYDLPAAIAAVKRLTGRERIFYCGHSMGGMLGYGYAGIHDDLEGLVTIGAAAELGRGFPLLRLLSLSAPAISRGLDLSVAAINAERAVGHALGTLKDRMSGFFQREPKPPRPPREKAELRSIPVDAWLKTLEKLLAKAEVHPVYDEVARRVNWLSNPARVRASDIRWLLREGGEREPRRVMEQFARWIRRGELVCYRTGYDFQRGFSKIQIPMAIIFGDRDPLASVASTRGVYRAAQSEYLLWRPVKGNSHIELTMGHDIRQICYDIKNLIDYARTHRHRAPSLPRTVRR